MSTSDFTPDPEELQRRAAETAFASSGEYLFLGRKLEPYSFTRQTAAEMLGLRYGRIPDADLIRLANPRKKLLIDGTELTPEERSAIEKEGNEALTYKGMVLDVAIVLWLMSQPAEIARAARVRPEQYLAAIDEWAEAQKIGETGANYGEALKLFSQVMNDLNASRARPEISAASGTRGDSKNG